jgi:hypothetical protein
VTGASLSNTADAGANFQIVATNELTVQRNDDLETGTGDFTDTSGGNYSDQNGTFERDYANISQDSFPNLTVDNEADGNLNMSFATGNNNNSQYNRNGTFITGLGDTQPYNGSASAPNRVAPLEIVNSGGTDKDVGATYNYGSAIGNGIQEEDVAQLFEFEIDGVQISPDESSINTELNAVTIPAGESREVDFLINYNDDLEQKVSEAASGGSDFGFGDSTSSASADLLDQVTFGTSSGEPVQSPSVQD